MKAKQLAELLMNHPEADVLAWGLHDIGYFEVSEKTIVYFGEADNDKIISEIIYIDGDDRG